MANIEDEIKIEIKEEEISCDYGFIKNEIINDEKHIIDDNYEGILQNEMAIKTETDQSNINTNECIDSVKSSSSGSDLSVTVCNICSCKFEDNDSLRVHMRSHKSKSYECELCLHQCSTKLELYKHILLHPNDKKFVCEVCGYRSITKLFLKAHMEEHQLVKPSSFICKHCHNESKSYKSWKEHLALHKHSKNSLKCKLCDFQTNTRYEMKVHKRTTHVCNNCEICGSKFLYIGNKLRHLKVFSENTYQCKKCNFKCETACLLNQHLRIHVDKKRHQCEQCGLTFRNSFILKSHQLQHTGERPFSCDFCSYKCRLKRMLSVHIQKIHINKPFKCDMCIKAYKSSEELAEHKVHHTVEKYPCRVCDARFFSRSKLGAHLKSHIETSPSTIL